MSDEETLENGEKPNKVPSVKAAYQQAYRANQRISELEKKLDELINVLNNKPLNASAGALRPGQMIHNVIVEDDESGERVEEIVCPNCGTRELHREKIPTKIEVKKEVEIPDNYMPIPRSVTEILNLLDNTKTPDGKPVYLSDKFLQKIADALNQAGYKLVKAR